MEEEEVWLRKYEPVKPSGPFQTTLPRGGPTPVRGEDGGGGIPENVKQPGPQGPSCHVDHSAKNVA